MAKYLLIESRDPFESPDSGNYLELAKGLVREGHAVTIFLVQNGVFPARPSGKSKALSDVARAGVEVLADDFSLRERGIALERLVVGVKAAPLSVVIDHLAAGSKTVWH